MVAYLIEENRLLRRQIGPRRLRFTDDDRRRLAAQAYRVGRTVLREIATIATPDTLLRWHRQLIARKWTYASHPQRRGILLEIRRLVVRMAEENPTWGYTRIQGALKNVGHRVGRSTIRRILKTAGLPPVPQRPTSWRTFLRAYWGVIAGADFFTTEVWTWRGLVTYYTVFVIDLASRRVQVLGSTPHPTELFMDQATRKGTAADDGLLVRHRVLICDRDRKWSRDVRRPTRRRWHSCGTDAGACAERECPRRALCPVDQGGMSQSNDSGGGATLPACPDGIRRTLSSRTEPPRARESPYRGRFGVREIGSHATPSATRRIAKFRRACSLTFSVE